MSIFKHQVPPGGLGWDKVPPVGLVSYSFDVLRNFNEIWRRMSAEPAAIETRKECEPSAAADIWRSIRSSAVFWWSKNKTFRIEETNKKKRITWHVSRTTHKKDGSNFGTDWNSVAVATGAPAAGAPVAHSNKLLIFGPQQMIQFWPAGDGLWTLHMRST